MQLIVCKIANSVRMIALLYLCNPTGLCLIAEGWERLYVCYHVGLQQEGEEQKTPILRFRNTLMGRDLHHRILISEVIDSVFLILFSTVRGFAIKPA